MELEYNCCTLSYTTYLFLEIKNETSTSGMFVSMLETFTLIKFRTKNDFSNFHAVWYWTNPKWVIRARYKSYTIWATDILQCKRLRTKLISPLVPMMVNNRKKLIPKFVVTPGRRRRKHAFLRKKWSNPEKDQKAINAICTPLVKDDMSSVVRLQPSDAQLRSSKTFLMED